MACLRHKRAGELLPYTAWFPLLAYGTGIVPREPAKVFAAGEQAAIPLLQGNTRDEHVEFTLAGYPRGITARQHPAMLETAFGPAATCRTTLPGATLPLSRRGGQPRVQ
ncbi:hypothetical protein ACWDLG_34360 [Nonomuraea sp. NPDC003727]